MAATADLFPGSKEREALQACERAALAACLVVGRAILGRGGNAVRAMVDLLHCCRVYAERVNASETAP